MSHELRTPLNAIIGYSEILCDEATDPAMDGDLRRIQGAGRHLLDLIEDILDIARIEADRVTLRLESFILGEVIEEVTATLAHAAARQGDALVVDCGPDVGLMVSDPVKVRQILFNLVSNAIKFTRDGTVRVVARREVHSDRRAWVRLLVVDTGIGMTPEEMGRIFDAFAQADNSASRRFDGAGLGLTICQHLCRYLGGDIFVSSSPGAGSTFTVLLPSVLAVEPPGE